MLAAVEPVPVLVLQGKFGHVATYGESHLISGVGYEIPRGFKQLNLQVQVLFEMGSELVPDDHGNVFCRRIQIPELGHLFIEVLVIESVFHLTPD